MKLRTRLFAMVLSVLMIVTSANVMIMAVNEPTITVSSVQGKTGDVVEVTVTLDNNPGIVSMSLNVEYDQTALHLIGVKDSGLMPGEMHTDAYSKMPYPLTWENDTSRVNFDVNGVVVTLSFEIIAKTAGDYDINISVPRDGIYNVDTDNIDFNIVNGNVSVSGSHTHSMNHTAAVTATCRATGNVEYWYCSSCEKYFADENGSTELSTISVDKNAENHVGGTELRNVKVATATEEGYTGDTYCLGCGVKIADGKTVPIVAETESIKITVSKDSVLPGEEAIVYVNVEENPGVNYMQLSLNYDDEHLTLSNVVYGSEFGDALVSEKNYSWSKSVGDFEGTGLLMELHFTVAEDEIESVYPVTIEKGRMGINDWNEQNIALVSIDGSVEVILGIAGDINKDKSVNGKDNTRLLRYMNGDNVIVDDRALDTNGDSNVNGKDTTRLLRVLNGDKLALYYNGTAFYPNGTSNTLSRSARVMSIQRDATPVIAISIDDASAIPGGGFSVTAMVTSNPGVNYMQLTLNYDDTYLTLSNVTYGSTFGEALNTGKNYTWSKNVGNMEGTGELVTMTFQVSEDAPIGVYSDAVTLTEGANGINDWDENSIKLSTDGCTLSVVCNHSMTYNVAKTATCIEAGNVAHYYCSKCKICFENEEGTNKIDNVVLAIDAKKHTELIANAAVEATCKETGNVEYWHCSGCEKNFSDEAGTVVIESVSVPVNKDNHTGEKEVRNAVEATCGDDGYTGDTYCKSCGEKITDGTFVPATENHIGGEATCKLEAICDVCGNSYGSTEASNHKGDTEVRDAVEATCGDDGYTGDTYCNDCGEKISDGNVISATGEHSDTDEDKLCDVCGADLSCKHMGEKEVRNAVEATCVKEGYTGDVYCKNCGKKIRDGMIVEATGIHTPGNWIIDEEATSEEVGLKHKECVLCGLVLEIREISVVESGFDFNDWYFSMAQLMNRKFTVSAGAGEGGSISNEGITKVKYNNSITYYITPADGYDIDAVYVNGRKIGVVNEYTFKNVSSNQSISVTFVRTAWDNPFIDISDDAEYIEAIEFVYENELFKGISKTEFAPEMTMTRAMFVTVLGRLAGVDADMYTETSFDDVVSGEWYAPYVEWAASEGIVNGYGNGTFGVNDEITIEQAVVILTRYAEYTGAYCECDVLLEKYADSDEVCYWAVEAMKWAVGNGIYTCRAGEIAPQRSADRALIANMIYNYVTIFHK